MNNGHLFPPDGDHFASLGVQVPTGEAMAHPSEPSTFYLEPATDTGEPQTTDGVAFHRPEQLSNLLHTSSQGPTTPPSPFLRPLLRFIHHHEDRLMGVFAGLAPPPPPSTLESETLSSYQGTPTVLHTMQTILLLGVGAWTERESTRA